MLKRKFRIFSFFSLLAVSLTVFLLIGGTAFAAVSYLGPAGDYTEEAAVKYFGENERIFPFATAAEALKQVLDGTVTYAVLPVENAMDGPVYRHLDLVIEEYNFIVAGEVTLPIKPALMALPGTKPGDIKTVLSDSKDMAWNEFWVKNNLPQAKMAETPNAAEAAKKIETGGDKSLAVIAPPRAALAHNLNVLSDDIRRAGNNASKFWIITTKNRILQKGDKAVLIVTGDVQKLPRLLTDFDRQDLKVAAIHARPAKSRLGQYAFLIEVVTQDIAKSKKEKDVLLAGLAKVAEQQKGTFSIRVLGIYDQASD